MTPHMITRDEVVERSSMLPGFPPVITAILATIDDPEANFKVLVDHIQHDPVITARVLSLANAAATRTRRQSAVHDIFTATSLIGMGSVREMAVISSIADFVAPAGMSASFWQHSIAVGVCSEELSLHTAAPASASSALIAGLLHDVGQLWLYRFNAEAFRTACNRALSRSVGIEDTEREQFGVDHTTIGSWLAEHWSLPANIRAAIHHHHAPDTALAEPLVPLVHIAEVLSNALDLTGREENHVVAISAAACHKLGLGWSADVRPLFGRMEARSRHANATFHQDASKGIH